MGVLKGRNPVQEPIPPSGRALLEGLRSELLLVDVGLSFRTDVELRRTNDRLRLSGLARGSFVSKDSGLKIDMSML